MQMILKSLIQWQIKTVLNEIVSDSDNFLYILMDFNIFLVIGSIIVSMKQIVSVRDTKF